MIDSRVPLGAHHSWLGFWTRVEAGAKLVLSRKNIAWCLLYLGRGGISGRWVRSDGDRWERGIEGDVRFQSPDHAQQTFVGQSERGCEFFSLLIPTTDAEEIAASEGLRSLADPSRTVIVHNDPELRTCMAKLASRVPGNGCFVGRDDEAARRLVLRMVELSGGGVPEWHDEGSVFDTRSIAHLVQYIDAHLKIAPGLEEMGMRVGLSSSHFAKKFRRSTGLSLHTFINRRRIRASLESLRDPSSPLAHVAIDLGFSSQSHFTRIFSGLTGMTPAKYRKLTAPFLS